MRRSLNATVGGSGRTETWKRVVGYEGLYEVSDLGNVRSLDRRVNAPQSGGTRLVRGRMLKPCPASHGYLTATICDGSGEQKRTVHALVLEAFAGPCPPGMEALHGPGGALDNRWPENLRWGTRAENCADKHRDGTVYQAKLDYTTVAICHLRRAAGATWAALGREYGTTPSAIQLAVTGRTWKHVRNLGGRAVNRDEYTAWAVAALTVAVEEENDFAGWLAGVLARVAARKGSSDALIAGRPGSWEASFVDQLVKGTVGYDDAHLADYTAREDGQR